LFALAHQVPQHAVEAWPFGHRQKLSGDLVIGHAGDLPAFAGELGMMARDEFAGFLEDDLIEIAFLAFWSRSISSSKSFSIESVSALAFSIGTGSEVIDSVLGSGLEPGPPPA
jgi:hypothetical protein